MSNPEPESPPSLNEELRRLEDIVRRLEASDLELDDALALFEDGVARIRSCRERLQAAEAKVRQVLERADGTRAWRDVTS
jgi:exodeoxyribonuclease VII small subunit